ncbi:Zinc finger BED domain-containing protein 4 [Chionoecetes opilio]|uniref:Zinc finger BED domain-containing protein 4 n=1 Tax=Chionoecetes opilio TaxID=41210 RepID=A0A8J4YBG6_CHIOP|nr:Zinc finger BED domain-containing protein 4 [Chionoecetes opilio]
MQKQHSHPVNKLIQDVETRWNSTYYMMERYLEQNESVKATLCLLGRNDMCLSNDEITLLQSTVNALRIFEEATKEMSAEKVTSLSKIIPMAWELTVFFRKAQVRRITAGFYSKLLSVAAGAASSYATARIYVLRGHFPCRGALKEQDNAWEDITKTLTAPIPQNPICEGLPKRWQVIKSAAKVNIAKYKRALTATGHARWMTTMDAAMGYHQITIAPESQDLTCFITPWADLNSSGRSWDWCPPGDKYNAEETSLCWGALTGNRRRRPNRFGSSEAKPYWAWTEHHEAAFLEVKVLISPPILAFFDPKTADCTADGCCQDARVGIRVTAEKHGDFGVWFILPSNDNEPLWMDGNRPPTRVFESVSADYFHVAGRTYVVYVDASRLAICDNVSQNCLC